MEDEIDVSSIEAQYGDQTIMDIYSDFGIQPHSMDIDNFNDMDISSTTQPISETVLLSSSKIVLPKSEYEYVFHSETITATSLELNQNYTYYDPVDLQYVLPVIHSSSMDFNLDITDQTGYTSIMEEHVASKIDSQPITSQQVHWFACVRHAGSYQLYTQDVRMISTLDSNILYTDTGPHPS